LYNKTPACICFTPIRATCQAYLILPHRYTEWANCRSLEHLSR
jgi:hypothetical protein